MGSQCSSHNTKRNKVRDDAGCSIFRMRSVKGCSDYVDARRHWPPRSMCEQTSLPHPHFPTPASEPITQVGSCQVSTRLTPKKIPGSAGRRGRDGTETQRTCRGTTRDGPMSCSKELRQGQPHAGSARARAGRSWGVRAAFGSGRHCHGMRALGTSRAAAGASPKRRGQPVVAGAFGWSNSDWPKQAYTPPHPTHPPTASICTSSLPCTSHSHPGAHPQSTHIPADSHQGHNAGEDQTHQTSGVPLQLLLASLATSPAKKPWDLPKGSAVSLQSLHPMG